MSGTNNAKGRAAMFAQTQPVAAARQKAVVGRLHRAEDRAAQRAKNDATKQRVLTWLGKDKSFRDLASHLGVEYVKLHRTMASLNAGSHDHHAMCDLIDEKLP